MFLGIRDPGSEIRDPGWEKPGSGTLPRTILSYTFNLIFHVGSSAMSKAVGIPVRC